MVGLPKSGRRQGFPGWLRPSGSPAGSRSVRVRSPGGGGPGGPGPPPAPLGSLLPPHSAAMETFCETVQFYLKHLEDSVYPVMTEDQFAMKLFPMYRYFVTVWLRNNNPEVRSTFLGWGGGSRGPPQVMAPQLMWLGGLRDHWVQPHSRNPGERQ